MKAAMTEWVCLGLIISLTLIPAMAIGGLTSKSLEGWYKELNKPSWNPPNWLFGPVWSVLYICMSVAVWLVWKEDPGYALPLQLYCAQLLLNFCWSPTFFLLKRPDLAFVNITLLWLAILATSVVFALQVPAAGQLMIPYLGWVSFAAMLNYRLWQDNKT